MLSSLAHCVMADGHFFANKIASEISGLSHAFSQQGLRIFGQVAYV